MARREDQHYHHKIHYASILPSNTNGNNHNESHIANRRSSEQERTKALYLDFEGAFQDETTNHDYFGFQSTEHIQQNSHPLANFHLQSVETISEVKNTDFSPYIRYQASRETSHSSTPSDTPPFQTRYNHRSNPSPLLPSSYYHHHHHLPNSNDHGNLHRDFTNLKIMSSNDSNDVPAPFSPDAIRFKMKQQEKNPNSSSQSKLTLPQYFLVKYLGRTPCAQLWGAQAVRNPIDDMVRGARQLSSMNEIPTLEACVNKYGLTLTHRDSPTHSKHHHSRNHSPERHQHGLIPLENISYAMHDIKYSKVASCIVLRQSKTSSTNNKNTTETLTECYAFLFQSKEHAHRFALTLAEAFNIQKQSTRTSRQNHDEKREERSPQRRSRRRSVHHHDRIHTGGKHNDNYLGDSKV
ncbi:unnamed protein product [Rotaria sp. Silwood2]|nr:unnamed protein product [Rotaria sp. Silwood2]CAF2515141.1 unnamed protein product [Rotaria sp. Silwood2]CAF3880847.1 unnamed protein product [Rotaria sp. Silwood2]CAF4509233.1 unnamed protein product [Rotaria sp. Silwood2]